MTSQRARVGFLALLALALGLYAALPAFSYLPGYTAPKGGGTPGRNRWDFSAFAVQWSLNLATGSNVQGSRSAADVIQASFNTWLSAPNASLAVTRGADSAKTSAGFDGINLICFTCSGEFGGDETLGVTISTISDQVGESDGHGGHSRFVGQILDADILFNPNVAFSTGGASGQDLQTVATHEIGHFFGLDHSAVVRAIMFPFAPDSQQTLSYDDAAGIANLYPKSTPDVATGVIAGSVQMTGGSAVFGAHVFADPTTGNDPLAGFNLRKTPMGTLTLPDGSYRIEGLPADSYIVVAEPLDLPVTNQDVQHYGEAFGAGAVQTGFTTRWH